MKFLRFRQDGQLGVAVCLAGERTFRGLLVGERAFPGDLTATRIQADSDLKLLAASLSKGQVIDPITVERLPPVAETRKIICVGLNYVDHSAEAGFELPNHPTVFARFESSFVGDGNPLVRPCMSEQFDYEGELVAVVGTGGKHISTQSALEHVLGYSVFNDASVRDVQFRTPQWTLGKNFDSSGAFGPFLVTTDELPPGCKGLQVETRLNGVVVQSASTDDLVFDVAALIHLLSETLTLEAGDIIVTGTPSGVGMARTPQLWMKNGDMCEVEVERVGLLRNLVVDEVRGHSD